MESPYADLAFDRGRVRIHLCKRRSFVAKVDRNKLACFDAAGTATGFRLIPLIPKQHERHLSLARARRTRLAGLLGFIGLSARL